MSKTGRLGDLLVSSGAITREQLGEALRHQERAGGRLGTNLVELGFLDERALAGALAKQLSIPSVSQAQLERIAAEITTLIPERLAARLRVIPLRLDNGRLWLAMSDPSDKDAADEVSRLTKKPVRVTVAPDHLIQDALERYYRVPPRNRPKAPEAAPLGGMAVAAPIEISIDEEVPLDDADVATGFLDDTDLPPPPVMPVRSPPLAVRAPASAVRPLTTPVAAPIAERAAPMTLDALMHKLAEAESDGAALDALMQFLSPAATRMCALLLANGQFSGWRGHNIDMAQLLGLHPSLEDMPLFRQALDSGKTILGDLTPHMLGPLAGPLGAYDVTPGMLLPLRLGRQPIGVLLGVDAAGLQGKNKELDKLVAKIDYALHMLHLRRLLLAP